MALHGTPTSRLLRSTAAAVLVVTMAFNALPASPVAEAVRGPLRPLTDLTGLSQNWSLFAPVPRRRSVDVRIDLEHVDGSRSSWSAPTGGRILAPYRYYRWRKWTWQVARRERAGLHAGAAAFAADRAERAGLPPVVLARVWRRTATQEPAGSGIPLDPSPPFREVLLLELDLRDAPPTSDPAPAPDEDAPDEEGPS